MNVYQPVRGGAWYYRPWNARASYRDRDRRKPSFRFGDCGFRWALVVWRHQ